ncbi:man(5)GlcNAc(2)-PP-dolichol translocation protein RFT1-like [Oscarella lobularis]|uniref:man(5)GlcNAc(2)-PP-dolichol translocation protein RFT1-like n=1 Tax=Oscarella lobularis TaxID=121494 RepID=UPI003313785C
MTSKRGPSQENALRVAATGASYNAALHFSLRIITFALNAIAIRWLNQEIIGVANVRLALLYTTVGFISKEPFRKALIGQAENRSWRQTINLTWGSFPFSICLAFFFGFLWIKAFTEPDVDYYRVSVCLYAFSAVLETMAEPLFIISQSFLFVRTRVIIEGIGFIIQCIVTALLAIVCPSWGVLAYSFGIVIYSSIYVFLYFFYFGKILLSDEFQKKHSNVDVTKRRQLWPHFIDSKPLIDRKSFQLVRSFVTQSLLKQILTEGERYVMTLFGLLTFAEQGVYDVVNNLGSMIARFLFRPMEESFYIFFSNLLDRSCSADKQDKGKIELAARTLKNLLTFATLVGMTAVVFGYSYSYLALDLYGGKTLSTDPGPTLLRWYAFYVLVIAVNGLTECFYFAAMSQEKVNQYNKYMFIFSALFLVSAVMLIREFGPVGFILANCLNMLLRIINSIIFIRSYFRESQCKPLWGLKLSNEFLLGLTISGIVAALSQEWFCCDKGIFLLFFHVAVGGLLCVILLVIIVMKEKELKVFITTHFFKKQKGNEPKTD